jgi:ATP/ADP translocase/HEAT repeat protein
MRGAALWRRGLDGLCRKYQLEPDEGRVLVLMGALVATLVAAYTIAKVLRDALFIAEFGALSLPYAYIGVALASVGFVWIDGRAGRGFTRVAATQIHQIVAIACGALAAALLPIARHWTIAAFYLWTGSQAMMLFPHFWGLALDVWDSRRARQIFPALAGCGLLGGLAGGALAAWATPILKRDGLMWAMVVLLAVAHVLTRVVERARAPHTVAVEPLPSGSRWAIVRGSRYLQVFAVALALSVMVGTLVDFEFKYYLQHLYTNPRTLTQFLGKFYVVLNAAALLFQFGAAAWVMQRFGLGLSNALQPTAIVMLSSWVALSPIGWAIFALRGVQGVVSQSLGKAATEIYYAAVRSRDRRRIKPAIDTLVERWSDAAVGVLLILVLHAFHVRIRVIAVGTAALAGLWLVFAFLLNRAFGTAFAKVLSGRWIDLEAAPDSMAVPAARRAVLEALRSGDASRIVLALQLSESARDPAIGEAVRDALGHASPQVRRAAVRAMEAMRLPDPEGAIRGALTGPDEELRLAAVRYLLAVDAAPASFAREMLGGADLALREHLVEALAERPDVAATVLTSSWVDARLATGTREDALLAARALGVMAARPHAQRLRALLTHEDDDVRREALRAAARRPNAALVDVLLERVRDPESSHGARQALAAIGDPAVPGLTRLLGAEHDVHAQELAARTLANIATPGAIAALLTLSRSGDVRVRYLGLRGLARMRVRIGRPVLARADAHRLFLRELGDYRGAEESALALEKHAAAEVRLLGESYRESADMALERALQALACWYEPRPLPGVFGRLRDPSRKTASPALEYLGHVLPRSVFRPVQRLFETSAPRAEPEAGSDERIAERIRLAWGSGDEWLRACAVRASRAIAAFDLGLFAADDHDGAPVRAELAALAVWRSAARPAAAERASC